jgi:Family of unknown function (DUF6084)
VSTGIETEDFALLAPEPQFSVVGAAHVAFAATPTMVFTTTATDASGFEIQSIALSVQVMIDPAKRGYDAETRDRLTELFGPPASWAPATSGLFWARVSASVPGFAGSTSFAIEVPCTYDLEVAAAKYFYALSDGEVPLSFHFNGTVFFRGADDRLQMVPVAWSTTASYRMPVAAWQAMMTDHYPGGGWVRLSDDTLDRLNHRRATRGQPSFDACIAELLEGAGKGDD